MKKNKDELNPMPDETPSAAVADPEEQAKRAKKEKRKKIILRVLMALCLVIMAVTGYQIYEIWNRSHVIEEETAAYKQYLEAEPAEDMPEQVDGFTVDWAGLKAANPNITAWLIVPGTGISFPVVQAADNSYYLNHSFDGAYNNLGAVFLDASQNPDYNNDNSIIYAHSVDIGGMFTNLRDFGNLDFFNAHPYFWLLTPEDNYRCTINAFYTGADNAAVYTTSFGDFRTEVMNDVEAQATFYRPLDYTNRRFVTLSTCNLKYGLYSNQRFAVMGMMELWTDPVPKSEAN